MDSAPVASLELPRIPTVFHGGQILTSAAY